MRPVGSAEELERRRRRAVELTGRGEPRSTVARILGINPMTLDRWVRESRRPGGLAARPHAGPSPGLSSKQLAELEALLLQGATAHGWHNNLWTAARVACVIERQFGISYHPEHVRKILKDRLMWTTQRPNHQNVNRDDIAIGSWVRTAFPAIVRAASARGADVVFVDETGFMLDPTVRRTFAPRGQTPVTKVAHPHARISVIGGIVVRPGTDKVRMVLRHAGGQSELSVADGRPVCPYPPIDAGPANHSGLGSHPHPRLPGPGRSAGEGPRRGGRIVPAVRPRVEPGGRDLAVRQDKPAAELRSADFGGVAADGDG